MSADRRGRAHLEAEVEAFFVKRVRLLGGLAVKLLPMPAGIPDRLVLWPDGRAFLVELKQEGENPSKVQGVWHERLDEMNHPVVVLRGRADCLNWLREIVDSTPSRALRRVH